jgi:hypothetical protein
MLGLDRDAGLRTVDEPQEGGAVTRRLHLQNLAAAWQFAEHFTPEELSQLWALTCEEALRGWKSREGGSPR